MNRLTIIGNLVRDPEMRTTQTGKDVCTFTVAVNKRKKINGQPDADFFRVSAWEERGRVCHQYLQKGRKVAVNGPVSVSTFTSKAGETRATLEVMADEVEFLFSKPSDGFTKVDVKDNPFEQDELPWQ